MAAARLADAWSAARRTFGGARAQASRIGDSSRVERANSEPHMTQAGLKTNSEPTMEDILASIRRIIAEDYSAQSAGQPQAVAPQPQRVAQAAMPQASTDILDLNSRGDRFQPPLPEVVPVPPPPMPQSVMPRAVMPQVQPVAPIAAPAPAPTPVSVTQTQVAPPAAPQPVPLAASATQGFAARAVSEFSERLGRSFAAAERYQREAQASQPQVQLAPESVVMTSPEPAPMMAREPVTQSAVQAVAAAVQSHLAEAQAAQSGLAALITPRAPDAVRLVEPNRQTARAIPQPELRPEPSVEDTNHVAQGNIAPPTAAQSYSPQPAAPQRPIFPQSRLTVEPRASVSQNATPVQSAPPAQPAAAPQSHRSVEPVMQNDPPPAWLLSPKSGSSVSGSFRTLQEKQPATSVTLTDAQSSGLQELMTAALRPMLKDWLDAHLPGMVERMITAEIQRVTRGE